MIQVPVFAVVGRVNKGKSSIVATLAEDESVRIDHRAGTTIECRSYPVVVDGQRLFELVDTPGFHEAPRALAWLKERSTSAASRAEAVTDFVREFGRTEEFQDECRLLRPILEGASILYVVDGTKPYRANYEAEMEILQWTGQPSMALVNKIGEGDHSAAWRAALNQYFRIVRDFDAFSVNFTERIRLLRAFRELREDWSGPIDGVIEALEADRRQRREETASIVTDLTVHALTFTLTAEVEDAGDVEERALRTTLEKSFHDGLRSQEQRARGRVQALYRHGRSPWEGRDLWEEDELRVPAFTDDLFAETTWAQLGLGPRQLLALYAGAGAAAGGTIDVMAGGSTFLTGTLLGAASGALAGVYQLGQRYASATGLVKGLVETVWRSDTDRRPLRIGPHPNLNFPWIVLDRALLHFASVIGRTHARRDAGQVTVREGGRGPSAMLDDGDRKALESVFQEIRKYHADVPRKLWDRLHARIQALLKRVEDDGIE